MLLLYIACKVYLFLLFHSPIFRLEYWTSIGSFVCVCVCFFGGGGGEINLASENLPSCVRTKDDGTLLLSQSKRAEEIIN